MMHNTDLNTVNVANAVIADIIYISPCPREVSTASSGIFLVPLRKGFLTENDQPVGNDISHCNSVILKNGGVILLTIAMECVRP